MNAHAPASAAQALNLRAECEAMVRLAKAQSHCALTYLDLARRHPAQAGYYRDLAEATRDRAWTWMGFARLRRDELVRMGRS